MFSPPLLSVKSVEGKQIITRRKFKTEGVEL